jgi:SAM-dependent methyltransferase
MKSMCPSDVSFLPTEVDLRCHVCDGSQLHRKFSVPLLDGPHQHDENTKHRTIYRCDSCGHLSGNSYDAGKYASYYASLPDDYHCEHDNERSRYQRILELLPKRTVKRVLDVGCGTGTFLAMLPPEVERFGIEPSRAAADHARAKGIQIIQYNDLARPDLQNTFDFVTAIDVVEHSTDLQEFRRHLATALRPAGTVIILTGDAESRSARLLGRCWYYLSFAEHITIFCPRSMRTWLQPDFSEIEVMRAGHHRLNGRESISLVRAWLLFPVKWLLRNLVPWGLNMRAALVLYLPRDHMLVRAIRNHPLTRETAINGY